jgi:hypothetical protein
MLTLNAKIFCKNTNNIYKAITFKLILRLNYVHLMKMKTKEDKSYHEI